MRGRPSYNRSLKSSEQWSPLTSQQVSRRLGCAAALNWTMSKPQDRSADEAEQRQPESLEEIDENLSFSSAREALSFISNLIHLIGDAPDDINTNRRVVRWIALGTGSSKAGVSSVLSMFDRELIGVRTRQFANEFDIKNDRFDSGLFFFGDTISRDDLVDEIEGALEAAGHAENDAIMQMVNNPDYVTALSDSVAGMGRNAANFPVKIAPHLADLNPFVNALTPPCSVDSFIFINTGGGSATGFVPVLDRLFRNAIIRPSSYNRDVHQVVLQTEGRASNAPVEKPGGEMTTTNAQQHQAVELLDDLRADGYIQNIFHVHRPLMAHAYTVEARNLPQDEIEDNIGDITSSTDHDQIHETAMTNRAVNANRDNHVMNDTIRKLKAWENIARVQSEPYELLSFEGDVDRADVLDRAFKGKMLVPCMRSVASAEELHGKNSEVEYPKTLEESVRALTGLLPHSRLGPAPTVTGATVIVGIAGDSELNQPDIDTFIETPAAEALELDNSNVTGMVCNNLTRTTIPGGVSWLNGFMLLEVEDTADTLARL